jgi:hypothetical protein
MVSTSKLCIYMPTEVGLDFLTRGAFNRLVAFTSLSKFLNFFDKFNVQTFHINYSFWISHSYKSKGFAFGMVVVS